MSNPAEFPQYMGAELDDLYHELMEEWKVPGASLAIVHDGDIHVKAYGVSRIGGPQLTENTLFNCASMSKSVTAAAIALLVDDDRNFPQVKFSTPVSDLIPEDFVLSDPEYTRQVTIYDMLSHRSGMLDTEDICFGMDSQEPSTPRSLTRALRYLPITDPIRTKCQYNNSMFTAASYLIEQMTKEPFSIFLQTRFFKPLDMNRTYLATARSQDSELATGYFWDPVKQSYTSMRDTACPGGQGAGNIVSSVKDWAKWIRAMVNQSCGVSESSLCEITWPLIVRQQDEKLLKPHMSPRFYGMGWDIQWYRGYKVISHGGGLPGFVTFMVAVPQKKWGAVFCGNSAGNHNIAQVMSWTLIDKMLGVPQEDRFDWVRSRREEVVAEKKAANDCDKIKELFPDKANPPLPTQLPLAAYTGRYVHPAYRELVITIKNGQLFADVTDRTFGFTLTWQHVSGDHFVVQKATVPQCYDHPLSLKSTFNIGASGKVERVGVDFLQKGESEYIWLTHAEE